DVVVVLWCCHAAASEWVAREITLALEDEKKQIAPVLLCRHPAYNPLSQYQWIDLRAVIRHTCSGGMRGPGDPIDPDTLSLIPGERILSSWLNLDSQTIAHRGDAANIASVLEAIVEMSLRGEFRALRKAFDEPTSGASHAF